MAHLITSHDPYHVHKVLGLLALFHYVYRYYLVVALGTAFPGWSSSSSSSSSSSLAFDASCVFLHLVLSWSSLLLPLPKRRNLRSPMIWPEFRYHSILFATRHVACTLMSLAGLWPGRPSSSRLLLPMMMGDCLVRTIIVVGTSLLASYVSRKYGDPELRTTNSMPYPRHMMSTSGRRGGGSSSAIDVVRSSYATAQFGATMTCVFDDPSLNFAPLLGIQVAPLLMTLVRKGKIGCGTYHAVYALSLCAGYVVVFVRMLSYLREYDEYDVMPPRDDGTYRTMSMLILFALPFSKARREWNISALTFWSVVVPFATVALPAAWRLLLLLGPTTTKTTKTTRGAVVSATEAAVWIAIVRTFTRMSCAYAPLFVDIGIGIGKSTSNREGNDEDEEDEDDDDDRGGGGDDDRGGDDDGRTEASSSASSLSD